MGKSGQPRALTSTPERQTVAACTTAWREQRALCDALETIADSLPDKVDRQACLHAARTLPGLVGKAHRVEEESLFTALETQPVRDFDVRRTLARLRLEHVGDACFAEELAEVLFAYGAGQAQQEPEATGYMLRAFFEALRRHIAIEEELAAILEHAPAASRGQLRSD